MTWYRWLAERIKDAISEKPTSSNHERKRENSRPETQQIIGAIENVARSVVGQAQANRDESSSDNRKNRRVAWVAVVVAFIYALVAALQWFEFRRSNELTRQALNETRRSNELTLRAWVVFKSSDGPVNIGKEIKNRARLNFENVGKLPANNISVQKGHEVLSKGTDFPELWDYTSTPSEAAGALGPGHRLVTDFDFALSVGQLASINAGESVLYLHGEIRYDDGFRAIRSTTFCGFYDPTRPADSQVRFCPHHNAAQ